MPVSANTLFHFTPEKTLKQILLSSRFFPSYSEEHFENIVPKRLQSHRILLIPFVSFCDLTIIQLARDSKHTKHYSKYGIGLEKEWGNINSISPVTYVHKNSPPANQIFTLYNLTDKPANDGSDKILSDLLLIKQHMTDSFKYLKSYKGYWHKRKKLRKPIIYYDEREWRFTPAMDDFEVLFKSELIALYRKNYERELRIRNSGLRKYSYVKFKPDNVKYIIVNREKEIEQFARWIKRNMNAKAQSILLPKLISFEKIESDF
jgi:hypothetical protein